MQTFLPYADFTQSSKVLDWRRLGKQRGECKQIYKALTLAKYGWKHHPAVRQWLGYEAALVEYARVICTEWRSRGYKDVQLDYFMSLPCDNVKYPPWLGMDIFHSGHRKVLLFKDISWYSQYMWTEPAVYEYWWPSQNGY